MRGLTCVTHRRSRRGLGLGLGLGLALAIGCADDQGDGDDDAAAGTTAAVGSSGDSTGAMPTGDAPMFEATVDPAAACGSATALELRATRVGCVSPSPAPCTVPNPLRTDVGDRVECPSDATDAILHVEVPQPGRYYVEVVAIAADGTESGVCQSDGTDPEVLVDDAAFDGNAIIAVSPLSGPCPAP